MIRKRGFYVPPRSRDNIRKIALTCRDALGISKGVKVIDLIESILPLLINDFYFEVNDLHEMGEDHARTYPDKKVIQIRQDVYENALRLNRDTCGLYGRDNFTLAHEVGHLVLHQGVASYARSNGDKEHKAYEDSEWQADTFAAEFLMPFDQIAKGTSILELQERFLVSNQAATYRLESMKKG